MKRISVRFMAAMKTMFFSEYNDFALLLFIFMFGEDIFEAAKFSKSFIF